MLVLAACGTAGFERGAALTARHDAEVGVRAHIGMPRGRGGTWVTQFVVRGESDGLVGAAGGVALRAREGRTVRGSAAFGVAGRTITGDTTEGRDGVGPYGELLFGLDWPLGEAVALSSGLLGSGYWNADHVEWFATFVLGVVWK